MNWVEFAFGQFNKLHKIANRALFSNGCKNSTLYENSKRSVRKNMVFLRYVSADVPAKKTNWAIILK